MQAGMNQWFRNGKRRYALFTAAAVFLCAGIIYIGAGGITDQWKYRLQQTLFHCSGEMYMPGILYAGSPEKQGASGWLREKALAWMPLIGYVEDHIPYEETMEDEETIAKILQYDTSANQKHRRRLHPCEICVDQERKVENAHKGEKRLPEAAVRDVISRQQGAEHECRRPERAVENAYLLFRKAEPPVSPGGFEEKRDNLHHESFTETVEDYEKDIPADVFLGEEVPYHRPEFAHDGSCGPWLRLRRRA